jgi:hypothetical protein
MTRNPLAGFWIVPLMVFAGGNPVVAMVLGGIHGMARSIGIISNVDCGRDASRPASWAGGRLHRRVDGLCLLCFAGALLVVLINQVRW